MKLTYILSLILLFGAAKPSLALSPHLGIQEISVDCDTLKLQEKINETGPEVTLPLDPEATKEYCPLMPSVTYIGTKLHTTELPKKLYKSSPEEINDYCMNKKFFHEAIHISFSNVELESAGTFLVSGKIEKGSYSSSLGECLMKINY